MKIIKLFVIHILLLSSFQAFAFSITTGANFSTPENTAKVIDLTTDGGVGFFSINFAILPGEDADKFTLVGNDLTFEATDFEAQSDATYRVKVRATRKATIQTDIAEKTITVTVTDLDDEAPTNIQISNTNLIAGLPADTLVGTLSATDPDTATDALTFTTTSTDFKIVNGNQLKTKRSITAIGDMTITVTVIDGTQSANQEFSIKVVVDGLVVTAQAVRKESKSDSKLLLSKVGRTLMGRLSHIRHKNKQKSSFSVNDFVNGIQVSFADSQTNSFIIVY